MSIFLLLKKNKVYHQLGPLCFFFLVLLLGFIFIFCLRYPKYNLRPERENKCLVFGFNKSAGFSFYFYFFFKGNQSKARSGPDRHWQALLFSPCPAEQTADRRLYREDWKLSWVSISSSSVDTTFNIKPHKNAFDVQSSEIRLRCFLLYLAQIHRLLEDLEGLWNANASKFTCWSAYGTFLKSINNVRYT